MLFAPLVLSQCGPVIHQMHLTKVSLKFVSIFYALAYGSATDRKTNAVATRDAVESFNGLYNELDLGHAFYKPKFGSKFDPILRYGSGIKSRHFPAHSITSYLSPFKYYLLLHYLTNLFA